MSGVLPSGSDDALPSNCTVLPATPVYGPPGRATGGWLGVEPMVAVVVAGLLAAPRLSVTTRVTVNVPVAAYTCVGVAPLPLAPSPNVQA